MTQQTLQVDLFVTDSAFHQIKLMKEMDYTLSDKEFRIAISGKGCHGFDYQTGFAPVNPDDIKVLFMGVTFIMDPFTAHYCQKMKLDFLFDETQNIDGFIVENFNQDLYQGKFFKDPTLLPPGANK